MSEQIYEENQPQTTEEVVQNEVKADAKERSFRTLKQGLLVSVGLAVLVALLQALSIMTGNDMMSGPAWVALGVSLIQTAASAALSYIQRFTKTPEFTSVEDSPRS